MKKNNIILQIIVYSNFLLLIVLIVNAIIMLNLGNLSNFPIVFGSYGLIGLIIMFIGGSLLGNKKTDEEKENDQNKYYIDLVERAEINPISFNKKLKKLSELGNIYIMMLSIYIVLCFLGIIMGGVITGYSITEFGIFIFGVLSVTFIIIKSIYIKPYSIIGDTINKDKYPLLFKIINNAIQKTNSPKLDRVFIYPDADCYVSCVPVRLGFVEQNVMYIGLHVLELLDDNELEAILIHELAHIYNKDTSISNKMNKSINRWTKILESCEKKGIIVNNLLRNFAVFYIIKMEMYFAAISKQREFIADLEAAKYMGKETYFAASTKIELMQYFFSRPLEKNTIDLRSFKEAPKNLYNILFSEFYKQYEINKNEWLNQILKRVSTKYDSHPSFYERMIKIGINDFNFNINFKNNNKSYKNELKDFMEICNKEWYESRVEGWNEFSGEYIKSSEIVEKFSKTEDMEKNYEYALALENLNRFDDALEFYNNLLNNKSDDEVALFRKGGIFLDRNNENGIDFIRKAMELNSDYIRSGLQRISIFLDLNGMKEKKAELEDWAQKMIEIYNKKMNEIDTLNINDIFVPAKIDEETLLKIKKSLSKISSVKRAFLVTKELKYTKADILVLAVVSKGKTMKEIDSLVKILNEIEIPNFLLDLNENINFIKPIAFVQDSEIYRRQK